MEESLLPHRPHPSLTRIFQQASPEDTIVFIDESYVAPGEEFSDSFYSLVATAIKFKHLADTRFCLKEAAQSTYWHTTDSMQTREGQERVEAMLRLCYEFGDSHSVACLRPLQYDQDVEHARQDCLEKLITTITGQDPSLNGIIFEERRSQSDNDKDRNTLKRLRKSNVLPQGIPAAWVSPADETCLWVPDLVAYMYRRTLTHGGQSTAWFNKYLGEHCQILMVVPRRKPLQAPGKIK
ncbi:hypothetical protein HMPREF2724_06475 [Corynebacterium sp. HMSC071F07]|uniref:hypothetical protein n=1 Tax=Corynebacterium sp. HMSC071F07 TaxID=1715203 RepID=UPI0008A11DAD|nr:hypothetical protein [Corynebacterium sp. HMSC071F07]OFM02017.1 hypothetical protein HMPREF2724_06475 [Corynebacterium sp. HMSC071F07]